jgi:hypothetical protein
MMFHTSFDTCIRSKVDFCLVYYRYKLDIETSVFFCFGKNDIWVIFGYVSTLLLLGWPLVEMSWNPIS